MKIRIKIVGSLVLMIVVVSCILAVFMFISTSGIRKQGDAMLADVTSNAEANVKQQLLDLANNISSFIIAMEAETDQNMLNAANVLYEVDRASGGKITLADLERLKKETGMSDLYLADMNGIFTLSTESKAIGMSLFDIWDGYRMLVTGKSSYLPSDIKIQVETGEIFKFTAIPRADNRGIVQSALNASSIETHLENYIATTKGIKSMNLFDSTLLTLTCNQAQGVTPVYTKGKAVPQDVTQVADLFKDSSKIQLTMDNKTARLYYPIMDGSRVRYVLFIDLDTSSYFKQAQLVEQPLAALVKQSILLNTISLAAVFAALLIFTILISIMVTQLLKPLGFLNTALASFSEGNLVLTLPEEFIKRKDEMGDISRSFENAVEKIKHLISLIRDRSLSLQTIGQELADQMTRSTQAINGITENIKHMTGQTGKQAEGVTETGNSVSQIMQTVNQLHDQIVIQAQHVSQSSGVIDGMLKNIHLVVETLAGNTQNVAVLTKSSEVGRKDLQKVSDDLQEIARESEGILQINAVMENISSQTNLLSMNAAIEAAHAGEAGKGFAVVAGEIRKLAESASQQSKTTADMLKKIKASIDTITESMKVVFGNFESIEREVRTVSVQEENIRSMMAEQERGSQNVLEAMSQLNSITSRVNQGSEEMSGRSESVIRGNASLKNITDEISADMNNIARSADEINSAVLRVNEISGKNKDNIDSLNVEIAKFKV